VQSADSSRREETANRTHIKQAHEIGGMYEQMSRKDEREVVLMQSLPGSNRTLRIQHYSKAQIPTTYLSETGWRYRGLAHLQRGPEHVPDVCFVWLLGWRLVCA
jgi:hypothetical protein